MNKMVRTIAATNKKLDDLEKRLQRQSEDVVLEKMSAVVQNNSLPNYFLHTPEDGRKSEYERGALVFVHHHRSAGRAMMSCLEEVAFNRSLSSSQIMLSDERLLWHAQQETDTDPDRFDIHRGQFAFGICNNIERNCSHITILRDPMQRAISSYDYCKEAYDDEICKVGNANDMTLRQWIILHGSQLFRQLVFLPEWCHLGEQIATNQSDAPCWYKHKLHFENLPPETYRNLLEYVVNNLDQWFAAIGLLDELEQSLQIFEHLYDMPFTKCSSFRNNAVQNAEIFDNRSNRNKKRAEPYSDDDPEYLKYDYEVQQALAADNKIYKKARQIFRVQHQLVLNKVRRGFR